MPRVENILCSLPLYSAFENQYKKTDSMKYKQEKQLTPPINTTRTQVLAIFLKFCEHNVDSMSTTRLWTTNDINIGSKSFINLCFEDNIYHLLYISSKSNNIPRLKLEISNKQLRCSWITPQFANLPFLGRAVSFENIDKEVGNRINNTWKFHMAIKTRER